MNKRGLHPARTGTAMGSHTVRLTELLLEPIVGTVAVGRMHPADLPGFLARTHEEPDLANRYMQLFFLLDTLGQREFALDMQARALKMKRLYRLAGPDRPVIRLLAFMAPGDMADNTPLEFLVEGSDIRIDLLYVSPGQELPPLIPDHDIAIVAVGESEKNNPILQMLENLLHTWPRPVVNDPAKIRRCARDETYKCLQDIAGLSVPQTQRLVALQVRQSKFPFIIRPIDTHAGDGLERLERADQLDGYLARHADDLYYVAPYVDYRSQDGLFRKARIALIAGKPYAAHLAVSGHWVVHYVSADMQSSESKRAEEAAFMTSFETDFAARHRGALEAMASRLGLDYVVIDCAEAGDGSLLLFEADNRGWIHATDPHDVFPYKEKVMRKAFDAFRAMLLMRSGLAGSRNGGT